MNAEQHFENDRALHDVRQLLLQLARREEELAAEEATVLPYWRACPPSVEGHRVAAAALRWVAEQFPVWYPNRGDVFDMHTALPLKKSYLRDAPVETIIGGA